MEGGDGKGFSEVDVFTQLVTILSWRQSLVGDSDPLEIGMSWRQNSVGEGIQLEIIIGGSLQLKTVISHHL